MSGSPVALGFTIEQKLQHDGTTRNATKRNRSLDVCRPTGMGCTVVVDRIDLESDADRTLVGYDWAPSRRALQEGLGTGEQVKLRHGRFLHKCTALAAESQWCA